MQRCSRQRGKARRIARFATSVHAGAGRPDPAPRKHSLKRGLLPLEGRLHAAVGQVPDPAVQPAAPGLVALLFASARAEAERAVKATQARNAALIGAIWLKEGFGLRLLAGAAGVVGMGGYNTFCEILSFDKRAVIVPRTAPRMEQYIRAARAQELGYLDADFSVHEIRITKPTPIARIRLEMETGRRYFFAENARK